MAIIKDHIPIYREIFKNMKLPSGNILTIGFQDFLGLNLPADYNFPDFKQFLLKNNVASVTTLDPFDDRSDLKYDLNLPIPNQEIEKYDYVIDIGSLEHIFDTKQAIENCMQMVKVGGYYFLHTTVHGLSNHGLHTFNHLGLIDALKLNNFNIEYLNYSSCRGVPIKTPERSLDSCIWLIGKKTKTMRSFHVPQQNFWPEINQQLSQNNPVRNKVINFTLSKNTDYWFEQLCPPLLLHILKTAIIKFKIRRGYKFMTKISDVQ